MIRWCELYWLIWSLVVQLQKFRNELKNRSRVLKKLGHIDGDGVVQLKGRAACLIDTGDELLATELMFNGKLLNIIPLSICMLDWGLSCLPKIHSIQVPSLWWLHQYLYICLILNKWLFCQVRSMTLIIIKLQLLRVVLFR